MRGRVGETKIKEKRKYRPRETEKKIMWVEGQGASGTGRRFVAGRKNSKRGGLARQLTCLLR